MFELQISYDSPIETSRLTISIDETGLINHAVDENFTAPLSVNDAISSIISSMQSVVVSVENI